MVPEYKKELLDYSLNKDKLGIFKRLAIKTTATMLSKLYSVEIFRNTDRMYDYINQHYKDNNLSTIDKYGVMRVIVYIMLKHLFGKSSNDTPENMFNKMKEIRDFMAYIEDKHDKSIKIIDQYLNIETLNNIIPNDDDHRKRFNELSKYLIEIHYRLIGSVELILKPHLYNRINNYCKKIYNKSFQPYPTPITLSEYMVTIVKSISEKGINGRFIESKLPIHLREYLLAYEKLIIDYIDLRNQYLYSN